MWKLATLIEGEWRTVEPVSLEYVIPSYATIAQAAGNVPDSQRLRNYLEQENSLTLEGAAAFGPHDAIELWSEKAEADAREFYWSGLGKIEAREEALAYWEPQASSETPGTLAWHDHTAVLIRLRGGPQQLRIEYTPTLRDENRVQRLGFRYGSAEHNLETIFEARGYYGAESAIIDHWKKMRASGGGYIASLRSTGGFLVGRVLRRLTRPKPAPTEDQTMRRRLIEMSDKFPAIASDYPDLTSLATVQHHDHAAVFIHGTVSCGIQGLKDLCANGFPMPLYRYEHDTFVSVNDNGEELAKLISGRVAAKRLLLVAHSRGGLVARIALAQLARAGYGGDLSLYCFGTPHEGTPLADIGDMFLNLSFKLGSYLVGSIPVMAPAVAASSYLIDGVALPTGIEVMKENSETLKTLNTVSDPSRVSCWGSNFDILSAPTGFGIDVGGALMGAMSGTEHDLVVPTHSAVAFGTQVGVLNCSHVHYFLDPAVQNAIRSFVPPPPPAVTSPAGGQIMMTDDSVWIAGVRVRRRVP